MTSSRAVKSITFDIGMAESRALPGTLSGPWDCNWLALL